MGIIAAGRDDTREFDAAQFDRLDNFVAQLKKHGIYCDLNLNVSRTYKAGDGVRDTSSSAAPRPSLTSIPGGSSCRRNTPVSC
jgi:hypothetical protein